MHTNAMCCAGSLANTCASSPATPHRKCASTSSAFICCLERLRNLRTLKMRLGGVNIGASASTGDRCLPLGVERCASRRQFASDSYLDTITCGRKGGNCVARALSVRRNSLLKHVRGKLHNPGDCLNLTTVKHKNKSVYCAAKSLRIRQLPDEAVYSSRGGSTFTDLLFNKSLFWRG
jgi:hypothetical protein